MTATEKDIAKKAIQRNAFSAHPENLLYQLCMLADDNSAIHSKAVIQKVQFQAASNGSSTDYSDEDEKLEDTEIVGYSEAEESDTDEVMVVNESFIVPKHMEAEVLTVPPLTLKFTNDEILKTIHVIASQ